MYEDFLEKEMHERAEKAILKLELIMHPKYRQAFSEMLSICVDINIPAAATISDDLDLSKIDFMAMQKNLCEFKKLYKEESDDYSY
jgi:hypothetical protein